MAEELKRIEIPSAELFELIEGLKPVERHNWRHGTRDAFVFEKDGKHWMVVIDNHHEEGLDTYGYPVMATRVWAHPVVSIEWRSTPPPPDAAPLASADTKTGGGQ